MSEQALNQILQEMRQGFAAVYGRLDRIEGRLDALEAGQAELRQAVVELQSSVNRIMEHEAEIRELKHA